MPIPRRAVNQIESRYAPQLGRGYMWQDDAACKGGDPEDFEYLRYEDPGLEARNPDKIDLLAKTGLPDEIKVKALNLPWLQESAKACFSCPVAQKCLDAASPADLFWTIRGGYLPAVLQAKIKVAPAAPSKDYIEWMCKTHGRKFMSMRGYQGEEKRPYCTSCAP